MGANCKDTTTPFDPDSLHSDEALRQGDAAGEGVTSCDYAHNKLNKVINILTFPSHC